MPNSAEKLLQIIPDQARLSVTLQRLWGWLLTEMNAGTPAAPTFSESRAKALLRVTESLDDPTLNDFHRLVGNEVSLRLALHELLSKSGLAESEEVQALIASAAAATPTAEVPTINWLSLALATFAWKREYPLLELDPASPPTLNSPAGSLVKEAAQFIRQQVQRSPTDRDRLAKKLAFAGTLPPSTPATSDNNPTIPLVPDPSVFRPPVPVRYPELVRAAVKVELPQDPPPPPPPVPQREPLVISETDLPKPALQPAIKIEVPAQPQPPAPLPPSAVVMPNSNTTVNPSYTVQTEPRRRSSSRTKTTRLRVLVLESANGIGLYGIQVKIRCRKVRVEVAGTTNKEGQFLCEVPVKESEGLTYEAEIIWPRDKGGRVERKQITLNADRTEFQLPFYHQYKG